MSKILLVQAAKSQLVTSVHKEAIRMGKQKKWLL